MTRRSRRIRRGKSRRIEEGGVGEAVGVGEEVGLGVVEGGVVEEGSRLDMLARKAMGTWKKAKWNSSSWSSM